MVRSSAETIPEVMVRSSPSGLPMATTGSPMCTELSDPSGSGSSDDAGRLSTGWSTATSVAVSMPSTLAL